MALTGIDIYKHLPKTNCKKCGFPTCLAFAMKLSQKAVELSVCPDVSEEAKKALEAAARPPIRLVTVGASQRKIEVGNEVVLFRHEKTFFHPPGLVVTVKDTQPAEEVSKLVEEAANFAVERVGIQLKLDGFAIQDGAGGAEAFVRTVQAIQAKTDLPLVLMSQNPGVIEAALEKVAKQKPLICAATRDNWQKMAELARKYGCPLAVYEPAGLTELAGLVEQIGKLGVEDMVLDPGCRGFGDSLSTLTQLRRLALKKNFRLLGYPTITFPGQGVSSLQEEVLLAGQHIAKYGGIIVLSHFSPGLLYPLLTLRLNIYTDPQKPIQVTPGIYPIAAPKPSSPLLVTTNFSLTYFSVAGETESSGFPSWLLVCDTEGLSVLTSWAAGKFDAEKIAKSVKESKVEERIGHRSLVIPGHVAVLRGELEEELPDWKILVGPREAVDIGGFLKKNWAA